jgi:hypothetical protein
MSCLFHSLGQLLELPSDQTRQLICDYLLAGGPIIDGMTTAEVLELECSDVNRTDNINYTEYYINRMRMSSTWGGAIEIQAAVNLWNVRVIVENRRDWLNPRLLEFVPLSTSHETTLLIYWTGCHYEPVSSRVST